LNKSKLLDHLVENDFFSLDESNAIKAKLAKEPLSIHWELRSLLYLGITLLSSGIGILVYQNIDTIGHSVLIGMISLLCFALFLFTFKYAQPFSWGFVKEVKRFTDFALLGACITFLTLGGYLQFQYNIFGERYGLATLIPAVLFFFLAYRFDHRGVLAMAITSLASSIGLSINPSRILKDNDFLSQELVVSAIVLGTGLIIFSMISERKKMKAHFSFTYLFYGLNLASVATLAGLFNFEWTLIYGLIALLLGMGSVLYARKTQSYIFMLSGVLYGYISFSYLFVEFVSKFESYFFFQFYFLASAGGVIYFLINLKKLVKGKS
jgi:hypothetical protein